MDTNYLAKKIYSKKTIKDINKKIKLLGSSINYDVYNFLNIRLFGTILIFLIFLFISKLGFMIGPLLAFLYYKLITYIMIDYKIKIRSTNLEREAINFFEILALSIETGRNLNEALNVTVESSEGELASEFKKTLKEVKYGKSLTEALEDMEKRMPTDTINNIILSLTQADLYGSSIITSLRNQIEYLRNKRVMEVKAEISKVPIKISVISVFFFIPLILIIILAPVLLSYMLG